jgi:hypothetical protein
MKKLLSLLIGVALLLTCAPQNAFSQTKAKDKTKKINFKIKQRDIKKEVKKFEKQGFAVEPGNMPMATQLKNSYEKQREIDDDGIPKWIIANGSSTAQTQSAAEMQATEMAKNRLVGLIGTHMKDVITTDLSNNQLNPTEAASLTRTIETATNIVEKKLGRVLPLFKIYRKVGDNTEVQIELGYSYKMAMNQVIEEMKYEIKQETEDQRKKYNGFLGPEHYNRGTIDNSRGAMDNNPSTIDNSRGTTDNSPSIIDNSRGTIDNNKIEKVIKIWVPEGSTFTTDGKYTNIHAPDGYTYIANTGGGQLGEVNFGSICCDCGSRNGQCYPFVATGGYKGCATNGCTSCSLSASTIEHTPILEGGFVNFSFGVSFAKSDAILPMLNTTIAEYEKVDAGIREFVNSIYMGKVPPEPIEESGKLVAPKGYTFAMINVYGRGAMMLVPSSGLNLPSEVSFSNISCSSSCTGGCTPASGGMGSVKYCKSTCNGSCCMSGATIGHIVLQGVKF